MKMKDLNDLKALLDQSANWKKFGEDRYSFSFQPKIFGVPVVVMPANQPPVDFIYIVFGKDSVRFTKNCKSEEVKLDNSAIDGNYSDFVKGILATI